MNRKATTLRIGIIGCGRVGRAFAIAARNAGFQLAFLIDKNRALLPTLKQLFPDTPVSATLTSTENAELILLTVNDDALPAAARELAATKEQWARQAVVHTSGGTPSSVLSPLKEKGAFVASLHPVQTFSGAQKDVEKLQNCHFVFEGDPQAYRILEPFVQALGGRILKLTPEQKIRHHLACVFLSNYIVSLIHTGLRLIYDLCPDENQRKAIYLPLLESTVANTKTQPLAQALTGPIARGDVQTVASHLRILREQAPGYRALYCQLGLQALDLLQNGNLFLPRHREIKDLLSKELRQTERQISRD
jgi:predicted short-subunit dehydrogenase-like oxidoreductase (DUF2520 family)